MLVLPQNNLRLRRLSDIEPKVVELLVLLSLCIEDFAEPVYFNGLMELDFPLHAPKLNEGNNALLAIFVLMIENLDLINDLEPLLFD